VARWIRRSLLGLAALTVVGVGACQLFWPERFAVNGPLLQMLLGRGIAAPPAATVAERLRAPDGFTVGRFAEDVPNARFLRFTPTGDLLVSQPRAGKILLLERDADGDGRADGRRILLDGLDRPHGMDLHDGWLYVAEGSAIARTRFDPEARSVSGPIEHVVTGLPEGGNHWTRTVRFGPDGRMYVSVGSSCNVCLEKDPRRAAMLRFEPDGSGFELYATGLRNSVGFDWRPGTDELYATDNGRDLLGDDFPPCELNRIEQGRFYGWPFATGDRVIDPDYGAGHEADVARTTPPVHAFRPHNAPLGMTFVRNANAPDEIRGAALVALHGSWNRTKKDGYQVVSLHWQDDGQITERPFLWGFLVDEDVIGRPVDVAEGPDGAIYVSDDYAGSIYRVAPGPAPPRRAELGAPSGERPSSAGDQAPVDSAALARGRSLFDHYDCASCHDPAKAAQGVVAKPLRGLAARYPIDDLDALLRTPTPPMPVFPLTAAERRDLAVFLRATYP
jgi:glucose/arabinose dehydrogenase